MGLGNNKHITRAGQPILRAINRLARFSGTCQQTVLCKYILPMLLGPAKPWSLKSGGYAIGQGAIFNSGAFCIFYGDDPKTGEKIALLHRRKEVDRRGRHKYGALGGYTEIMEQAYTGLTREVTEEVCDGDNIPVIEIDPGNLILLFEGKDFVSKKPPIPPVQYTGYAYKFTLDQILTVTEYGKRFDKDPAFRRSVQAATNGESFGVEFQKLEKITKMGPERFSYQSQRAAYREVARRLGKPKPSNELGYTLRDMGVVELASHAEIEERRRSQPQQRVR